jgi:hypothetical protein
VHMKVGDCASDQRQQSNASDRCPPDPPVRAGGHDRLPTGNSPVSTHWFFWCTYPSDTRDKLCTPARRHLCDRSTATSGYCSAGP